MALITRCPVCGTRFKVVPDQLRISDGWVRCGECAEVFDASMDLTQSEAEPLLAPSSSDADAFAAPRPDDNIATKPLSQDLPPVGATDSGTGYGTGYVWSAPPAVEVAPQPRTDAPFQPAFDRVSVPTAYPLPKVDDQVDRNGRSVDRIDHEQLSDDVGPALAPWDPVFDDPEADDASEDAADAANSADRPEPEPEPEAQADERDQVPQSLTEFPADMSTLPEESAYIAPPAPAEVDAALDDPRPVSFLKEQSAPEVDPWQRPWTRRGLYALAGLLVLTLGVQAAVQQRDQIAARLPGVTPMLRALCSPLGCTVQALRQIDAIVIDSSTFTTVRHGVYRLNLVLKNRANTEIAVPAIELALTDTQEQPVLRRVLQAADMMAAQGNIAPSGEWTASMELAVADEPSVARIVGYRLLAFYP